MGYLLGTLNPAAWLAKLKKENLRDSGTGNLGATNVMLHFGKLYGALVMIFDIAKAFVAVKVAELLFPSIELAGILAGGAAVVGHVYPFYMRFKGGKGLAAFGGMMLAVDPLTFFLLLTAGVVLIFITNYSVALPLSAAVLFPVLYIVRFGDFPQFLIVTAVCILIIIKFCDNLKKIKRGEEIKVREFLKKKSQ